MSVLAIADSPTALFSCSNFGKIESWLANLFYLSFRTDFVFRIYVGQSDLCYYSIPILFYLSTIVRANAFLWDWFATSVANNNLHIDHFLLNSRWRPFLMQRQNIRVWYSDFRFFKTTKTRRSFKLKALCVRNGPTIIRLFQSILIQLIEKKDKLKLRELIKQIVDRPKTNFSMTSVGIYLYISFECRVLWLKSRATVDWN